MSNAFLKQKLREEIKSKFKAENFNNILGLSKIVSNKVLEFFKNNVFQQILAYYPTEYEVQIQDLLRILVSLEYGIFLPRVILENRMDFFKYSGEINLIKGRFGIKEPKSKVRYRPK